MTEREIIPERQANAAGKPPGKKRGPIPGQVKLETMDEVLKEMGRLYNLGKNGNPKEGKPPLKSAVVMECEDRSLLEEWMARWEDVVDFEVVPVVTSEEAAAAVASRL